MSLTIRIISSPDDQGNRPSQYYFDGKDGTIGRDAQADIVLDDPHAHIDDIHATLRCTETGYVLTDNSRDGIFINNNPQALGCGLHYALQDGDMLAVGSFRLLVSCFMPLNTPQALPAENADDEAALCGLFSPEDNAAHFADDPFLSTEPPKKPEPHEIRYRFSAVARPYSRPAPEPKPEPVPEPEPDVIPVSLVSEPAPAFFPDDAPVELPDTETLSPEQLSREKLALVRILLPEISRALSYAADKVIRDISPLHMTALCRDQKLAKKIDYWQAYQQFFSRQTADNQLQNKLIDYFRSEFYTQIIESV